MVTKNNNLSDNLDKDIVSSENVKIDDYKQISNFSIFLYKKFKLIIFLEILLILFIGYFFIIKKQLSEIEDYNTLVLQKQKELGKIKEYKSDSLEFEKKYNLVKKDVEEDINQLYNILPPQEDLPNIMAQIEALVNSHGFKLGSINMTAEESNLSNNIPLVNLEENTNSDLIKEIDVNLFVFSDEGGYLRIKELLDALEHHIRFMDVLSFSFEEDMRAYSIVLKTYYLNYERQDS